MRKYKMCKKYEKEAPDSKQCRGFANQLSWQFNCISESIMSDRLTQCLGQTGWPKFIKTPSKNIINGNSHIFKSLYVITDVREKQIMNSKAIKSDNRFMWFTNLATSTAERERIFYYVRKNQITKRTECFS